MHVKAVALLDALDQRRRRTPHLKLAAFGAGFHHRAGGLGREPFDHLTVFAFEPEHAHAMRELTSCDGVQLGSSIERMAIERPIETRTASFKAGKLPAGRK